MSTCVTASLGSYLVKLERRGRLPTEVLEAFLNIPASTIDARPHDTIRQQGDESRHCLFVSSGFTSRQKTVGSTKQIIGIGVAGDAVDLQSLWFASYDHSIVCHSRCTIMAVEHRDIIRLCEVWPALMKALWHDSLVDAAIFREWTLNIGHRRAQARLAHFLLEVSTRLRSNGQIADDIFELPLAQADVASALGLSLVHVNKSLRALRSAGCIEMQGRTFLLEDRAALVEMAQFDPAYLHLAADKGN